MREEWVRSTMYQCASACSGACQYYPIASALESTQGLLDRVREGIPMAGALWCDRGDHPFSAKDQNKQHFSVERQENGRTIKEEMDVCGDCAQDFLTRRVPDALERAIVHAEAAERVVG